MVNRLSRGPFGDNTAAFCTSGPPRGARSPLCTPLPETLCIPLCPDSYARTNGVARCPIALPAPVRDPPLRFIRTSRRIPYPPVSFPDALAGCIASDQPSLPSTPPFQAVRGCAGYFAERGGPMCVV